MARPSKLTPEVTKRLTEAIRAGNYSSASGVFILLILRGAGRRESYGFLSIRLYAGIA